MSIVEQDVCEHRPDWDSEIVLAESDGRRAVEYPCLDCDQWVYAVVSTDEMVAYGGDER